MRPARFIAAVFIGALIGPGALVCPVSAAGASSAGEGARQDRGSVDEGSISDEQRVWVFFDAGSRGVSEGAGPVSERARERMRLRGNGAAHSVPAGPPCPEMVSRLTPLVERVRHRSCYFNAVSADVRTDRLPALVALPGVARVEMVRTYRRKRFDDVSAHPLPFAPPRSTVSMPLARAYGESYGQLAMIQALELLVAGYNGSGTARGGEPVMIGVLDTGFRLDHEALRHLDVHAQYDFINFDSVTANEPGDHALQERHGTVVLGALAGLHHGHFAGPAWGARFLLAKTEIVDQEIEIEEDNWIAGLEWCDSIGADIVSSSLGYLDWYTPDMLDGNTALCTRAAGIAVSRGIVVCNAVGNYGDAPTSLIAPADGHDVIAVGGVHGDGTLWHASSRGPTADGRIKPDLVAQAVSVVSIVWDAPSGYATYGGTSLATPLVAGLCAQLLEIHPGWNPLELRDSLLAHASRSGAPDNGYGHGIPRGLETSGLSALEAPVPFAVSRAYPNPFNASVRFDIRAESLTPVSVRVYDMRGALVRRLIEAELVILDRTIEWDGRNERGRPVASGVYCVEFIVPALRRSVKIVHLR